MLDYHGNDAVISVITEHRLIDLKRFRSYCSKLSVSGGCPSDFDLPHSLCALPVCPRAGLSATGATMTILFTWFLNW